VALIPDLYFKAVVAIGVAQGNQLAWIGTGFLYGHTVKPEPNGEYLPFLVTNKHVLNGQSEVILRFENSVGGSSQFVVPLLQNGKAIWNGHPDPEVDVAVLQINANVLQSVIGPANLFADSVHTLPLNAPDAAHLCEGDGIFLLGFPLGLVDQVVNLPIVRGGTLARIKDCRGNRSKSFLIDCQTFPGNSGGPVLIRPSIVSVAGTTSPNHCKLIGIVASYLPYRDVAVSKQTGREKIVFEENSGLSNVFPVDAIVTTVSAAITVGNTPAEPHQAPTDLAESNQVDVSTSIQHSN